MLGQLLGNVRFVQHPIYRKQQRRESDTGYNLGAHVVWIIEAHGGADYAKNIEGENVEPGEQDVAAMAVEVEGWKV